jgi:hypothetical protein
MLNVHKTEIYDNYKTDTAAHSMYSTKTKQQCKKKNNETKGFATAGRQYIYVCLIDSEHVACSQSRRANAKRSRED